nr:hypothetical protein [Tanacetum cinerariifolium]
MSNDHISQEISSGDKPRRQETTLGGADAQTRFKTASKKSCGPPLSEVNTSRSGEDRMEHPDDLTDFVPPTPHDSPLPGCHTPGSDEENKGSGEKGSSTVDQVSTARPEVGTVSVHVNVSAATPSTPPTTTTIFDSEKEEKKSVEPKSKGKKGKRIKRVADSTLKQKSFKKKDDARTRIYKEEILDLEILSTKYPIVDWESQNIRNVDMEDSHIYKIIRANRNTSYQKSISSMLRKFDRQDLVDMHGLVMKRFEDNTPESNNLLL